MQANITEFAGEPTTPIGMILSGMQSLFWYGGIGICIMLFMLYWNQESMLYIPNAPNAEMKLPENMPPGFKSPAERSLPFEDVTITASDGIKLRGWFIFHRNAPLTHPTLVFFHANAGNIGGRLPLLEILHH